MKLITGFLTVVGVILSATTAQAAFVENEYVCENIYMEVASECGSNAVKVEKNRLNKAYMGVYRTLSVEQKKQLDQEQVAWLKTRNDKCNFEHDGPMNNTVVYAMIESDICVANETQERSKVLTKKYNIK